MTNILRAELLKLRTTRTFFALVISALGLGLLIVLLATSLSHSFNKVDEHDLFVSDPSGLFIFLLGIMGMAGEWRHRTITSTVLAAPDRLRLLAGKVIAYAVAGAVLSLVVTVAIMLAGTVNLSARGMPTLGIGDLADILWRNLVVAAFSGALGVCIGGILRNQVVAIVGMLIFGFAVEPALVELVPKVGQFGFTSGAPNAILGAPGDHKAQLSLLAALLVMLGWVAVGYSAAGALLRRRDLV